MIKITITSQSTRYKKLELILSSSCKEKWKNPLGIQEWLQYKDGFVYSRKLPEPPIFGEKPELRLRFFLDTRGIGNIQWRRRSKDVVYELELEPGQSHTFYIKIPFMTLKQQRTHKCILGLMARTHLPIRP